MSVIECTRQNSLAVPYVTSSEGKAEDLADAIEVLFSPCIKTDVFAHGDHWCVAIVEGMDSVGDLMKDERFLAAVTLLSYFDFAKGTGDIQCVADLLDDVPAAQNALTKRAQRAFLVDDKLNSILARLAKIEATLEKEAAHD